MKNRLFSLAIMAALVFFGSSCATYQAKIPGNNPNSKQPVKQDDIQGKINKTAKELNDVEKSLNYWGKIAMSEPAFTDDKTLIKINFDEDVTNYVLAARNNISGDARSAVETALFLGTVLQGEFRPPISAGSPAVSSSTNGSGQALALPNQAETALSSFTPLMTLNGLNPTIDERQAVEKGINDKIAEELLKFMTTPNFGSNSNQQEIVFGVMQITCQPGQRTKSGYLADLNVSLNYGRMTNSTGDEIDANLKIRDDGVQPGVFAVLPLVDSRNVELRNSNRSQIELASALSAEFAAKGVDAAAKVLSDYVKRQESDANTRNSLPVVTSYTDGATFGFQIYPSFQALENPGKAGSGDILEPITFPAVVAIVIDKDEYLQNVQTSEGTNKAGSGDATAANSSNTIKTIKWNYLVTEEESRWIPFKHPFFINSSAFDNFLKDSWLSRHLTDPSLFDRIRRAKDLDDATQNLTYLETNGDDSIYNQREQLKIAAVSLQSTALGGEVSRKLPDLFQTNAPESKKISISDVLPHVVWRDKSTTFTILVNGTTNAGNIVSATIAGVNFQKNQLANFATFGTNGVAFTATLPDIFNDSTATTNSVDITVFTSSEALSKSIVMSLQGQNALDAVVTVSRDGTGRVNGIDIKPSRDLKENDLLQAVKDILEKSEPPPKNITIAH